MKRMKPFAVEEQGRGWFWWGISLGALLGLLIWWLLKQKAADEKKTTALRLKQIVLRDDEPEAEPGTTAPSEKEAQGNVPESSDRGTPDDLKLIEGIGPRSAQVLNEAGVTSFSKLAGMGPDSIQGILREGNVRVPYPETWPEQAALAAAGKWDDLKTLQDTLQGGRRV